MKILVNVLSARRILEFDLHSFAVFGELKGPIYNEVGLDPRMQCIRYKDKKGVIRAPENWHYIHDTDLVHGDTIYIYLNRSSHRDYGSKECYVGRRIA